MLFRSDHPEELNTCGTLYRSHGGQRSWESKLKMSLAIFQSNAIQHSFKKPGQRCWGQRCRDDHHRSDMSPYKLLTQPPNVRSKEVPQSIYPWFAGAGIEPRKTENALVDEGAGGHAETAREFAPPNELPTLSTNVPSRGCN